MPDTSLYWHFLRPDGRLNYPPHTHVDVGVPLSARRPLKLCSNGMHASRYALDALNYAPGFLLCRVELQGKILEDTDKACARTRLVLWQADATQAVMQWAGRCARRALEREDAAGRPVPPAVWEAIRFAETWDTHTSQPDAARAAYAAADAAARAAYAAAYATARAAYAADAAAYAAYAADAAAYAAYAAAYAAADAARAARAAADAARAARARAAETHWQRDALEQALMALGPLEVSHA